MATFCRRDLSQKPLAEGGESYIYNYNSRQVAKIFKKHIDIKDKKNKIESLASLSLSNNIIGPKEIVYDSNGEFIGYIMDKVDGEEFKRLCSKKFIKLNKITIKDIGKMLCDLQNLINDLHSKDIIIGDLNECNILFDKSNNVYLIDVDSWSVGKYKCTVAMESFQDPKMIKNQFTKETDWYAFAILTFKCLTMLHPFGGNTEPEIPILQRMERGISVINNDNILIPKALCKDWKFMSDDLLSDLENIFNKGKRFNIEKSLNNFYSNLKKCDTHNDYYYSKYNKCPICNSDAIINKQIPIPAKPKPKPQKITPVTGIACSALYTSSSINVMLSENVYVDNNNIVHFVGNNIVYPYNNKLRYYLYDNNTTIINDKSKFVIHENSNPVNEIEKLYGSRIIVHTNGIYYINTNNILTELKYTTSGNVLTPIQQVSFKNYFEVYDKDHYIIINIYDGLKIICVDGYNYEFKEDYKISNYGMHYDPVSGQWLLIIEDNNGKFYMKVFKKDTITYENNKLKLSCDLGDLCHYNKTLYIPKDNAIRGFNYMENRYKDFECSAVTFNCTLIKNNSKFKIVAENGLFEIG